MYPGNQASDDDVIISDLLSVAPQNMFKGINKVALLIDEMQDVDFPNIQM